MIDDETRRSLIRAAGEVSGAAQRVMANAEQPGMTKKEQAKMNTIANQLLSAVNGMRYLAGTQ